MPWLEPGNYPSGLMSAARPVLDPLLVLYTVCLQRSVVLCKQQYVSPVVLCCNVVVDCVSADVRHLLTGITVLASTPNHLIAPPCNALQFTNVLHKSVYSISMVSRLVLEWPDITESHFWIIKQYSGCEEMEANQLIEMYECVCKSGQCKVFCKFS